MADPGYQKGLSDGLDAAAKVARLFAVELAMAVLPAGGEAKAKLVKDLAEEISNRIELLKIKLEAHRG